MMILNSNKTLETPHQQTTQEDLRKIANTNRVVVEKLKKWVLQIDNLPENSRTFVWNTFFQLLKVPKAPLNRKEFLTPVVLNWLKEALISEKFLRTLFKAITLILAKYPNFLHLDNLPKATNKTPPMVTKPSKTNIENLTPFGTTFLNRLVQLHCLENWVSVLDKLAPRDKIQIWRVTKLTGELSTIPHDLTSFKKTVAQWAKDPMAYQVGIRLLFSAIGYLKNKDVLKHEFFVPYTRVPLFTELNEKTEVKKKSGGKKRKREESDCVDLYERLKDAGKKISLVSKESFRKPNTDRSCRIQGSKRSAFDCTERKSKMERSKPRVTNNVIPPQFKGTHEGFSFLTAAIYQTDGVCIGSCSFNPFVVGKNSTNSSFGKSNSFGGNSVLSSPPPLKRQRLSSGGRVKLSKIIHAM